MTSMTPNVRIFLIIFCVSVKKNFSKQKRRCCQIPSKMSFHWRLILLKTIGQSESLILKLPLLSLLWFVKWGFRLKFDLTWHKKYSKLQSETKSENNGVDFDGVCVLFVWFVVDLSCVMCYFTDNLRTLLKKYCAAFSKEQSLCSIHSPWDANLHRVSF